MRHFSNQPNGLTSARFIAMNVVYIIVGIALVIFGIWLTISKMGVFAKGEQGELGSDAGGDGLWHSMYNFWNLVNHKTLKP